MRPSLPRRAAGFLIQAANVTINCAGYTLSGSNGTGAYSGQLNTAIKNCAFRNFTTDIVLSGASNASISNITFGTPIGLIVNSTNDSSFTNLTFSNMTQYGIWMANNSNRNNFTGISINASGGSGIYADGGQNDSFDCAGGSLAGNNSSGTYGVYSSQFNTTVKNCNISNFQDGIRFSGAANGTISNTTASTTSEYGIYLSSGSNYNSIASSAGISSANIGVYLNSASNNAISNSTGTSSASRGLSIQASSSNTFSNGQISGNDSSYGALLASNGSANNTIANSTINGKAGTYAITLQSGFNTNNAFINNTILNSTNLVYLDANASGNTF